MKNKTSIRLLVLLALIQFGLSAGVFFWATKNGIGMGYDSILYVGTAERLLQGSANIFSMSPHYPPLYSLVLTLAGSLTGDVGASARWVHAFLYAANASLIGLIIYFSTRRDLLAMQLGFLVFITSRAVISMHVYALSEPLFFFLMLFTCLVFSVYIQTSKFKYLALASLLAGLGVLTRYMGAALLPPLAAGILLITRQPIRQKIKALLILLVLAALPITLWIVRNLLVFQSAANRTFFYHPKSITGTARLLVELFHSFLFGLQDTHKYVMALEMGFLMTILLGIALFLFKKGILTSTANRFGAAVIMMGVLFSITYVILLIFSINFLDAATQINERIMLPVYLILIPSVVSVFFLFSSHFRKFPVWAVFTAGILFSVWMGFPSMLAEIKTMHADGIGFNSAAWNESPTMQRVKALPPDAVIFSNGNDVIGLKSGFPAEPLPRLYESTTRIENTQYRLQIKDVCKQVMQGQAVIVYFDGIGREYLPKEYEIQGRCQLPVMWDTEDGVIWGVLQGE